MRGYLSIGILGLLAIDVQQTLCSVVGLGGDKHTAIFGLVSQ